MVAVPLFLVDLSTYWLIVQQETFALLRYSVQKLRLVERRSHLYHCLCNCGNTVSLSVLRYRSCVTDVWGKKICPSTPLHERPAQTVIPG